MSKVIWQDTFLPDETVSIAPKTYLHYGEKLVLPKTKNFPEDETKLVALPDRRAYRSMSRAAVLLSAVGLKAQEALTPYLEKDPYRVGLYCAVDNGPDDYSCAQALLNVNNDEFAEAYRKNRSPKQYLKQLPNLAPAQLGIFLNIRGPLNVYIHSRLGSLQALDQAEFDLQNKVVDVALVCAAMSLEDPMLAMRVQRDQGSGAILAEGAGALVLVDNGEKNNWVTLDETLKREGTFTTYGIADHLIHYLSGGIYHDRVGSI